MTRIDSATITLSVWDDTLGMRREVTFEPDLTNGVTTRWYVIQLWADHQKRIAEEQRIRLAAKDEPGNFVL